MSTRSARRAARPTLETFEGRQLLSGLTFIQKPGHNPIHVASSNPAAVALPDLKVNTFFLQDQYTLVLSIKNAGTSAVSNIEVELTQKTKGVPDRRTAKVTVTDTILPGQVVTKTYDLWSTFGRANNMGNMHYTATLDPANKIFESNESNNFAEFDA